MRPKLLLFAVCAVALAAFGQAKPASATVSCPETLKVTESAAPVPGWKAAGGQAEHAFERISVFNGNAGGQEYDLAPDDEKNRAGKIVQTWNLKNYRSMNIFLRCRYHDTPAVLFMDLPVNLSACTLSFKLDQKGTFLGKSSVLCR